MNVFMLWFDGRDKIGLAEKIDEAARYHRRKYGRAPEICIAHPATLAECPELTTLTVEGQEIQVRPSPACLPGHFWLGVEQTAQASQP